MAESAFRISHRSHRNSRRGYLTTAHGVIDTPTYMPVATYGALRLLDMQDLRSTQSQIVLGNALHLHFTAGATRIKQLGGLARFIGWAGPTLTDSGGYQISYMWRSGTHAMDNGRREHGKGSPVRKISDDGAVIQNVWTHEYVQITPELAMEWQADIGADIVMALDQPTFDTDNMTAARESLRRSHLWTVRSKAHWDALHSRGLAPASQMFFPIIQGGRTPALRRDSARFIADLGTVGIAIAGESIGIDPDVSAETISIVSDLLPTDKPLYGMGLGGGPEGFIKAVAQGLDMFDNTSPTRLGRCGIAFFSPASGGSTRNKFRFSLKKGRNRDDDRPIDLECNCHVCQSYTRAYLKHLLNIGESTGARLLSYHNVYFMEALGQAIRMAIEHDEFESLFAKWLYVIGEDAEPDV
jgi:queuine tRNA-ribosyltransferase